MIRPIEEGTHAKEAKKKRTACYVYYSCILYIYFTAFQAFVIRALTNYLSCESQLRFTVHNKDLCLFEMENLKCRHFDNVAPPRTLAQTVPK